MPVWSLVFSKLLHCNAAVPKMISVHILKQQHPAPPVLFTTLVPWQAIVIIIVPSLSSSLSSLSLSMTMIMVLSSLLSWSSSSLLSWSSSLLSSSLGDRLEFYWQSSAIYFHVALWPTTSYPARRTGLHRGGKGIEWTEWNLGEMD